MSVSSDVALGAYQVRLVALGVVPLSDGFSSSESARVPWTLSVCDGADASLHLPSRVIALPPGRVVLVPPSAARTKTDGDGLQLRVQFEPSGGALIGAAGLLVEPLVLGADELRDALCARLRRDLLASAPWSASTCARAKALVHLAIAAAVENGADAPQAAPYSDDAQRQLRPVLRYIDAHLDEPLENARLAAVVHASESHFIRLFRRVVGCTPARHVQERRVLRAADLLAQTSLTIDEIAERCGFANRFHFSRVFAQRMEEPPARYRSAHGSRGGSGAAPAS